MHLTCHSKSPSMRVIVIVMISIIRGLLLMVFLRPLGQDGPGFFRQERFKVGISGKVLLRVPEGTVSLY